MKKQVNPFIGLAPTLRRPLAIWNPLDSLRLLYWCFFFPQAVRWYVETFGLPTYQKGVGLAAVWRTIRHDPVQRGLVLQGLVVMAISTGVVVALMQAVRLPVDLSIVAVGAISGVVVGVISSAAFGVVSGVVSSVTVGVVFGAGFGVASDVALGAVSDLVSGVARSVILSMAGGLAVGVASGVALGAAGGMVFAMVRGVAFGLAFGLVFGVILGIASALTLGVAFGVTVGETEVVSAVIRGMTIGMVSGLAVGVAFGLTAGVVGFRLPDWVWGSLLGRGRQARMGRMAWLPLRGFQDDIEDWLQRDWARGVATINEVLAYSLQFIPVMRAVNEVLANTPADQLAGRVSVLADEPFDWELLYYSSAKLGKRLLSEVWRGIMLVFSEKGRTEGQRERYSKLRTDTPAQALCAGFWAWHYGDPVKALQAFEACKAIPHGEELYGIAQFMTTGKHIGSLPAIGDYKDTLAWLDSLPGAPVRGETVVVLCRLRTIAARVRTAHQDLSLLSRSAALGWVDNQLAQLLREMETSCPDPERPHLTTVAQRWHDVVRRERSKVGEAVQRQPVPNPYEGYSGLPVASNRFVGRAEILDQIKGMWATPALVPPLVLFGHRRMGKSSILRNLASYTARETIWVYLDMQDVAWVASTGELLCNMAQAIREAVGKAGLAVGAVDATSYATLGAARQALNALLAQLNGQMVGRRLVLAIDEYELIEECIDKGRIEAEVLQYLRAKHHQYAWLVLIFAGLHTLDEMGQGFRSVFHGQVKHLKVGYLDRRTALWLIVQPDSDFALFYEPALRERLYELTYGQPYLLQRLCWELVNHWNKRFPATGTTTSRTIAMDDLKAVLTPGFYQSTAYYFDGVWSHLSVEERQVLRVMADSPRGWWTRADLVARLGPGFDMDESVRRLLLHDVVVLETGGIRFAAVLMGAWVALQKR